MSSQRSSLSPSFQPDRTLRELEELGALTGDAHGAQRVAWTAPWGRAREWFHRKLAELPLDLVTDAAGNQWATLRGMSERTVLIGGHLDSVPDGGWLDGCLGVLAGLEVLRRLASAGAPPVTVRLVDWADEEGARFGHSVFGSTATFGSLDLASLQELTDRDGICLADAVAGYGIDLARVAEASRHAAHVAAYVELHIEQGPVLESLDIPLGVVTGTVGVERHVIHFSGQAAHAGATPMERRRDALGAAATLALAVREIARRHGGVGTVGRIVASPNTPTVIVGQCDVWVDLRHENEIRLASMLVETQEAATAIAERERVDLKSRLLWQIPPASFDPQLIELCEEAVQETCGDVHRLPSGAIHDATQVANSGVPAVMMFAQSLGGISHSKEEDTRTEHLLLAVRAFDRLVSKTTRWAAGW